MSFYQKSSLIRNNLDIILFHNEEGTNLLQIGFLSAGSYTTSYWWYRSSGTVFVSIFDENNMDIFIAGERDTTNMIVGYVDRASGGLIWLIQRATTDAYVVNDII